MWEYDTEEHKWTCRSSPNAAAPAPRGGCQVAVHNSTFYVVGGHTAWREGKEDMEKVHDDVWALDLQTWQVSTAVQTVHCVHHMSHVHARPHISAFCRHVSMGGVSL